MKNFLDKKIFGELTLKGDNGSVYTFDSCLIEVFAGSEKEYVISIKSIIASDITVLQQLTNLLKDSNKMDAESLFLNECFDINSICVVDYDFTPATTKEYTQVSFNAKEAK